MSMLSPTIVQCPSCQNPMPSTQRFCERCGQDRADRLAAQVSRRIIIVAVILSVSTIMLFMELSKRTQGNREFESWLLSVMATPVAVTLSFFGLWLWSLMQPLAAAVIGLVLYIAVQVVSTIMNPSTLIQSLLWKVFVIGCLLGAVKLGLQARRLREQAPTNTRLG